MTFKPLLWLGLALTLSGCLGSADSQKADTATTRFYQLVASKQYEEIYSEAAPELRTATSLADFLATMERVDNVMGACQAPVKRLDIHTNATQGGFFRNQGYTRTCANGVLTENVTIVLRNGQAQLAAYQFNSPAQSGD